MRPLLLIALVLALPVAGFVAGTLHQQAQMAEDAGDDPSAAAPVWTAPAWALGDRWDYTLWTPQGSQALHIQVVDDTATSAGTPVYTVARSLDNATVNFSRETLNRVYANGGEERVYAWPLRDGATWTVESGTWGAGEARAEHVRDLVTPLGLLEAYKITEVSDDGDQVEVVHYAEAYRNYARIENYEDGRLTLSLTLQRYVPAG